MGKSKKARVYVMLQHVVPDRGEASIVLAEGQPEGGHGSTEAAMRWLRANGVGGQKYQAACLIGPVLRVQMDLVQVRKVEEDDA